MERCENCRRAEHETREAEHYFNALWKLGVVYAVFSVLAMTFLAWRIHELESAVPTNCTQI